MTTINIPPYPNFIYGTAWKEEATASLVQLAIQSGFRAIDTANQRKHYHEPMVGEALFHLFNQGYTRDQIFLQSKFTLPGGQDHRLPYDLKASLYDQVHQSFENSLLNLKTHYLDSYLLHGPHSGQGLLKEDWIVWKAIEELKRSGKSQMIGVSNINEEQLKLLIEKAEIQPMIVQNRCFAIRGWDRKVRALCQKYKIIYQGFSLLTANPFVLQDSRVLKMAKVYKKTPQQIVFRFCTQIGILPLTGTTKEQHMKEDLKIFDFELDQQQLQTMENICS